LLSERIRVMADHLARIFGTEEDKVNCSFYLKIGACRHGDRCSRTHIKPTFSTCVIIPHMYTPPPPDPQTGQPVDDKDHFEEFYEEIIEELDKFGEMEELHVVENLGDHMFGNVYVKYSSEEEAEKCLQGLNGRYYGGRLLTTEYSPVTEFREARCRQFDEDVCARGGYCNFMHLKKIPSHLKRAMKKLSRKHRKSGRSRSRSKDRRKKKSRSRSGDKHRRDKDRDRKSDKGDRDRDRDRDRGGDRDRDRDKKDFQRGGSAERRAKIASWNRDRDREKTSEPPAGGAPAP